MYRVEDIKLATDIIEDEYKKRGITYSKKRYKEMARELLSVSYSIGGYPSKEILEKMAPMYIDRLNKQ
ncbi:hypothetical protein M2454_002315 [Aequitasia blattaphilus]|uniref:Uncharacterized protein n=1 Tax=Aequitasia blattaphilus TaxID=2949332 RepID=A0ABT1EBF3_9FIRM|nr:hypothetical protein [Aequitasia blattaphilus]MCP1103170.1 hypothetical protein [Aequitasia blattaphilus]MCR8615810.1 hypothetical protein [Aequitasia blattaphilus]